MLPWKVMVVFTSNAYGEYRKNTYEWEDVEASGSGLGIRNVGILHESHDQYSQKEHMHEQNHNRSYLATYLVTSQKSDLNFIKNLPEAGLTAGRSDRLVSVGLIELLKPKPGFCHLRCAKTIYLSFFLFTAKSKTKTNKMSIC